VGAAGERDSFSVKRSGESRGRAWSRAGTHPSRGTMSKSFISLMKHCMAGATKGGSLIRTAPGRIRGWGW